MGATIISGVQSIRRLAKWGLTVLLALACVRCAGRAEPICEAGATQACPCTDESTGVQICADDGNSWTECTCAQADGDADTDTEAEADADADAEGDGEIVRDGDVVTDADTDYLDVRLRGAVDKGPFVIGSRVAVSLVDGRGNPTGEVFITRTINDFGEFELDLRVPRYASIFASGFYYNEVTGALSRSPIVLRAFYEVTEPGVQSANINIITHLSYRRVRTLLFTGANFSTATSRAERELRAALGVGPSDFDPSIAGVGMNILGGDSDANAYLLAVSAVLARAAMERGGAIDSALQELVNGISDDLEADGELDAETILELRRAEEALDPDVVMTLLADHLIVLRSSATVPDIRRIIDRDDDGVVNALDCDDTSVEIYPGAAERCDGVDSDCDGDIAEDWDGDGFFDEECDGAQRDCDDADPNVHPEATERCNGRDDDCNGDVDEGLTLDSDGDGHSTPGSCEGTRDDCNDDNSDVHPGRIDVCNGIDDDCGGDVDPPGCEADPADNDLDGHFIPVDCNDDNPDVHPDAAEGCNGIDDDCDGLFDEGLLLDADGDGHSSLDSCGGTRDDCDDSDPFVFWGSDELGNARDDNCDGRVDEGFYFLPEGSTRGGIDTWFSILNPSDRATDVVLTYMFEDGTAVEQVHHAEPHSRSSLRARDTIGGEVLFSTVARSPDNETFVIERIEMQTTPGAPTWAHASSGVSHLAASWYLAEGSSWPPMETVLAIVNPSSRGTDVSITYFLEDGTFREQEVFVGSNSRATVRAMDVVPARYSFSTLVTAPEGATIAVERVGNSGGLGGDYWAQCGPGVSAPASTWYLVGGSTYGESEGWLTIMNPVDRWIDVDITFVLDDGTVEVHHVLVRPRIRHTVRIRELVESGHFFMQVETRDGTAIVADVVVYRGETGFTSWAYMLPGATSPASTWYLAEGSTRGSVETWLPIMNTSDEPMEIMLTFIFDDGRMEAHRVPLEAREYMLISARELIGDDRDFATRITSTEGGEIVVGRITFSDEDTLSANWAHAALGVAF